MMIHKIKYAITILSRIDSQYKSIGMDVSPSNGEPKQSPIKPPIIHPRNFDINDIVVVVGFIDDIMDDLSLKNGQH
ncbi:hypothetical protein DERP_010890 [Dermatophagoides pteronyssinus]|uniref:Uncharacterized protein n=1 Tax=Dermatophagoides pteronyssinus TaxID=6956 RepID=A0ABQ8JUU3_DERPT|nr:hypothetical protein DERP_010890 [Dermatophagoides pteronyssinus]